MKKVFIISISISLLAISCRKDNSYNVKTFHWQERNTLFVEEFNDNSNNWILNVDTTFHIEGFTPDPTPSTAEISNNVLNLYGNQRDIASAKLDLSFLHLENLKYFCIEIDFIKYRTNTQYNSNYYTALESGKPNTFKLGVGDYYIGETQDTINTNLNKINILYDLESRKTYTTLGDEEAHLNYLFKSIENINVYMIPGTPNSYELLFIARSYSLKFDGAFAGNIIVNRIEIYTIE